MCVSGWVSERQRDSECVCGWVSERQRVSECVALKGQAWLGKEWGLEC